MMPIPKFEVHEHYAIVEAMPVLRDAAAKLGIRGTEFAFYWPYGEDKFAAAGYICSSCAKAHGSILYQDVNSETKERHL